MDTTARGFPLQIHPQTTFQSTSQGEPGRGRARGASTFRSSTPGAARDRRGPSHRLFVSKVPGPFPPSDEVANSADTRRSIYLLPPLIRSTFCNPAPWKYLKERGPSSTSPGHAHASVSRGPPKNTARAARARRPFSNLVKRARDAGAWAVGVGG
jgi:hypothetical protein